MPTPVFFESFLLDLAKGVHDFSTDTIKITLCAAANAPVPATDVDLGDLTPITETYLAANTLTVSSVAQAAGLLTVLITDFNIVASGGAIGPFQHIVIYNDSAANDELIATVDIGEEVTLTDPQQITMDFNGTSGFFQLNPPA